MTVATLTNTGWVVTPTAGDTAASVRALSNGAVGTVSMSADRSAATPTVLVEAAAVVGAAPADASPVGEVAAWAGALTRTVSPSGRERR